MRLETRYSVGDVVYPVGRSYTMDKFTPRASMPIKLISVEVLDTGTASEITEIYGCEGTGEIYLLEDVFPTFQEAKARAEKLNAEL